MNECNHPALRIEPDHFWCSVCDAVFERKPAPEHIADMRERLGSSKAKRKPLTATPKGPDREDHSATE